MIGERLLPVIDRIVPYLDVMIATTFEWIDANPELVTQIGMVVAGLGAFMAIIAPILIGTSMMVSGWATFSYSATRLGLALLSLPKGLLALLNPMKLVRGALFALRVAALGPAAPAISGIMSALGDLIGWVASLFGPLDASAAQWEAWGESVGGFVGNLVSKVVSLLGSIFASNWSSLLTLDGLRAAWSGIAGFMTWDNVLTVLDWATWLLPLRWLEFIPALRGPVFCPFGIGRRSSLSMTSASVCLWAIRCR